MEVVIAFVFGIVLIVLVVLIVVGCYSTGRNDERDKWKKEAVKRGSAEYYLDENHERQWRWLTNHTFTTDLGLRIGNPNAKAKVGEE